MLKIIMTTSKRLYTLLPRLLAFVATLSATIVMATSHQTVSYFSVSFEAKYTDVPAFKYFVAANAIVTIYGFLVLFVPHESWIWRLVFALDVVLTMLMSSSVSAGLAIAEVGKKGNSAAGWLPICSQVPKYCHQATGALVAAFFGFIIYLFIVLYSIYIFLNPFPLQKN